jgi:hypothetical protein
MHFSLIFVVEARQATNNKQQTTKKHPTALWVECFIGVVC